MQTPTRTPTTRKSKTPNRPNKPRNTIKSQMHKYYSPIETNKAKEPRRPTKSKRPIKPKIVMEIVEPEQEQESDGDRMLREFIAENQARADLALQNNPYIPPVLNANGQQVLLARQLPEENMQIEELISRRTTPPKTRKERLAIRKANQDYDKFVRSLAVVIGQMREFDVLYNNQQLVISDMTPHDMFSETDPQKHKISEPLFAQILEDMKYIAELNGYVGDIENNMATDPDGFIRSNFKQVMSDLDKIHDRFKHVLVKTHRPIRA